MGSRDERETVLVADGYNGHKVLVYTNPIDTDGALLKLQVAEIGKEYMHVWKHKHDMQ